MSAIHRNVVMSLVFVAANLLAPCAGAEGLGPFDGNSDVGSPRLAGDATWNVASQQIVLSAAGANIWGTGDEFHFAWKKLDGDFILRARVAFEGRGGHSHRKLGLMVRTGLDVDAAHVSAALHGDGLVALQYRVARGDETLETRSPVHGADVLQLAREGSTLTLSAARFGDTFTATRVEDVRLGDDVYVGLFLCSHDPDVIERASFHNVRIVRPAPGDLVQYRDYLGSRLEIIDVASGRREIVRSSADPFEAPNWTPDGRALIYNASGPSAESGRLFRFDLATRTSVAIDTGPAIRNNNDHVLSFDGLRLGISDQGTENGESAIFTLPATGGTPRRITPRTPSYLHGWSPDGRFVVYTGGRDGQYDIYRIPSDGSGEELQLTDHPGLDDGSEYSPDGTHIYFNSERSGRMQIWRMNADGTSPERLTRGGLNDWFPHVSPDGGRVAFLSYGKNVDPAAHPYYEPVYLRLMPAGGGEPRVIAYLYGGQGTINVPSWSPDGRMLAFVSNTRME